MAFLKPEWSVKALKQFPYGIITWVERSGYFLILNTRDIFLSRYIHIPNFIGTIPLIENEWLFNQKYASSTAVRRRFSEFF